VRVCVRVCACVHARASVYAVSGLILHQTWSISPLTHTHACAHSCHPHHTSHHTQVSQLRDILGVRWSVFLLGPPGAGKTAVWRTLARVLTDMGQATDFVVINPKVRGAGARARGLGLKHVLGLAHNRHTRTTVRHPE
jgi:hypothetical protein